MKFHSREKLQELQLNPSNIRNICIIAHVDHGKTSLADALLVSNGLISRRLSGKIRYMDSRKDEQERGITMKSSCISLAHEYDDEQYLINLIDSPGHVDFTGEVSTAVRLSDGCIVVVDVVEGICSQTKATLRQAWIERIKPILVLNKMDRLIVEKCMTPLDAYTYLQQLLEQINAFMGELFTIDVFQEVSMKTDDKRHAEQASETSEPEAFGADWHVNLDDKDDSNLYFQPEKDNVLFASAIDGWAFNISSFSRCLASKLKISERALNKTLWGDYFINLKQKKILKGAQARAKKNLFVSMVLENVWSVYENVLLRKDQLMTEKIISSLDINLNERDLNSTDAKVRLQSIFAQWLPLADNVLNSVCKLLPSPRSLTEERIERLMCSNLKRFDVFPERTKVLKQAFLKCDSTPDAVKIICISKMFAVETALLPENKAKPLTFEQITRRRETARQMQASSQTTEPALSIESIEKTMAQISEEASQQQEEPETTTFIAFARIFSGCIHRGDQIYVLGPKHDPSKINSEEINAGTDLTSLAIDQHITLAEIKNIYMLMGRELEELDQAVAGNVIGIRGLEQHVLKTATLSDNVFCPPFVDLHASSLPILRVAVEPQNPTEMPQLLRGLKLLNQADPCVEVRLQRSGEHVIITTGEVHLQRCVDDLVERFACIKINVSDPIVTFRETIVPKPKIDMVNEAIDAQNISKLQQKNAFVQAKASELIEIQTPNKKSTIKFEAVPLPEAVIELLETHVDVVRILSNKTSKADLSDNFGEKVIELRKQLSDAFSQDDNRKWNDSVIDQIWSVGPNYSGTNLLIDESQSELSISIWTPDKDFDMCNLSEVDRVKLNYDTSFISGFQLATQAGPLCEEPMMGVCFLVKDWIINQILLDTIENDPYGPFSGQIMSTVKEGCRKAFQAQPQRLRSPMFSCSIQVSSEVLGKMYGVLGRRHGRIVSEEMQEGSQTFIVHSVIPVIESFQFSNEIRKQTSGMAIPQLLFSHWEVIDIDPFWVPTTEEEYLHFGEKADVENRAKKYVDAVRRRKGLYVDQKIVEFSEKQRTLSKNK